MNSLLTLEHLSLICQMTEKPYEITNGGNQLKSTNGNNQSMARSLAKTKRRTTTSGDSCDDQLKIDTRIKSMSFDFDPLGILEKCQQAELLFSMFSDEIGGNIGEECNANRLLTDSFLEHIKNLHNKELMFSVADSEKFTKMLANRPRDESLHRNMFYNYGR